LPDPMGPQSNNSPLGISLSTREDIPGIFGLIGRSICKIFNPGPTITDKIAKHI
jgi:hypothetical protein